MDVFIIADLISKALCNELERGCPDPRSPQHLYYSIDCDKNLSNKIWIPCSKFEARM